MYVCRRFERMTGGFPGDGCDMTPIPILLALPSNPSAIIVDVCVCVLVGDCQKAFKIHQWRGAKTYDR